MIFSITFIPSLSKLGLINRRLINYRNSLIEVRYMNMLLTSISKLLTVIIHIIIFIVIKITIESVM